MIDPRFKQFLIHKLVKNVRYNPRTLEMEIGSIAISGRYEQLSIYEEGRLYGYQPVLIGEFIQEIITEGINLNPRQTEVKEFDPVKGPLGQHLLIRHGHDGHANEEELLKIDRQTYLLVDHDRGALLPGTNLKVESAPWMVGTSIRFGVEDQHKTYETGVVTQITLLKPPDIYQYIDPSKAPEVKRRLYASHPNQENGFGFSTLSMNRQDDSLFIIEQENERAMFCPIQGISYWADAVSYAIAPICDIKKPFSEERNNLKILKNGELTLAEDCWIIVSKAQIEFY